MKILWVVNTIFPDFSNDLNIPPPVVGGWMYGLAKDISNSGIKLTVATTNTQLSSCNKKIEGIRYYLLKGVKHFSEYDITLEEQWNKIIKEVTPDVVHIHGVEYAHGLALIKTQPKLKYVISIQGLPSVIYRHYLGGITKTEILKNLTFRDIVKKDTLLNAKDKFKKRSEKIENTYLTLTSNIIGRTKWDYDHVKVKNSNCIYHFCNESLRDEFYTEKQWSLKSIKKHSIFLSQAGYPLKGLHKVIEAVALIKNDFPDIEIKIAGDDITNSETFRDKLRLGGYGLFIKKLIKKHDLTENIRFLGFMNANQMVNEYLNAHIFICPSSIENSPNSLGEAQILGVPSIGSYVGGIPDMIENEKTGIIYRFEEIEMLSQGIKKIFLDKKFALNISENAKKIAKERHSRSINMKKTIDIYNSIASN